MVARTARSAMAPRQYDSNAESSSGDDSSRRRGDRYREWVRAVAAGDGSGRGRSRPGTGRGGGGVSSRRGRLGAGSVRGRGRLGAAVDREADEEGRALAGAGLEADAAA